MDINSDQFITYLRSALHHIYEPDQLRQNPLASLLGGAGRVESPLALQQILLEAIEDLRPGEEVAQQSQAWMIYEVLFFRYVRGYGREAIANQIGISDRQLSREQRTALETLAQRLWQSFHLDQPQAALSSAPADDPAQSESTRAIADWDAALPTEKPFPWKMIVFSVLDLLTPLTLANKVSIQFEPGEDLPDLLVPQVALRHALLNVLGWMIPLAQQAELVITPTLAEQTLALTLRGSAGDLTPTPVDPGVDLARQLIQRVGGSLELLLSESAAAIHIRIPTLAQIPVLLIDDNPDTIQLFQRYVQGSRYSITGLKRPGEALHLVEKINPRIILIDLMMPELDGWDLLTQLRFNRPGQNIAILICSILPQESLARSLGADGFLQKPVLPQDFLSALDRQMEHLPQEPNPE